MFLSLAGGFPSTVPPEKSDAIDFLKLFPGHTVYCVRILEVLFTFFFSFRRHSLCLGLAHRSWLTLVGCSVTGSLIFRTFAMLLGSAWFIWCCSHRLLLVLPIGEGKAVMSLREGTRPKGTKRLLRPYSCCGRIPLVDITCLPPSLDRGMEFEVHGDKDISWTVCLWCQSPSCQHHPPSQ